MIFLDDTETQIDSYTRKNPSWRTVLATGEKDTDDDFVDASDVSSMHSVLF